MGSPLTTLRGRVPIAFGCRLTSLRMKASLAKKGSAEERPFAGMTPERQWSRMNDAAGFRWARLSEPE